MKKEWKFHLSHKGKLLATLSGWIFGEIPITLPDLLEVHQKISTNSLIEKIQKGDHKQITFEQKVQLEDELLVTMLLTPTTQSTVWDSFLQFLSNTYSVGVAPFGTKGSILYVIPSCCKEVDEVFPKIPDLWKSYSAYGLLKLPKAILCKSYLTSLLVKKEKEEVEELLGNQAIPTTNILKTAIQNSSKNILPSLCMHGNHNSEKEFSHCHYNSRTEGTDSFYRNNNEIKTNYSHIRNNSIKEEHNCNVITLCHDTSMPKLNSEEKNDVCCPSNQMNSLNNSSHILIIQPENDIELQDSKSDGLCLIKPRKTNQNVTSDENTNQNVTSDEISKVPLGNTHTINSPTISSEYSADFQAAMILDESSLTDEEKTLQLNLLLPNVYQGKYLYSEINEQSDGETTNESKLNVKQHKDNNITVYKVNCGGWIDGDMYTEDQCHVPGISGNNKMNTAASYLKQQDENRNNNNDANTKTQVCYIKKSDSSAVLGFPDDITENDTRIFDNKEISDSGYSFFEISSVISNLRQLRCLFKRRDIDRNKGMNLVNNIMDWAENLVLNLNEASDVESEASDVESETSYNSNIIGFDSVTHHIDAKICNNDDEQVEKNVENILFDENREKYFDVDTNGQTNKSNGAWLPWIDQVDNNLKCQSRISDMYNTNEDVLLLQHCNSEMKGNTDSLPSQDTAICERKCSSKGNNCVRNKVSRSEGMETSVNLNRDAVKNSVKYYTSSICTTYQSGNSHHHDVKMPLVDICQINTNNLTPVVLPYSFDGSETLSSKRTLESLETLPHISAKRVCNERVNIESTCFNDIDMRKKPQKSFSSRTVKHFSNNVIIPTVMENYFSCVKSPEICQEEKRKDKVEKKCVTKSDKKAAHTNSNNYSDRNTRRSLTTTEERKHLKCNGNDKKLSLKYNTDKCTTKSHDKQDTQTFFIV